ncbi:copper chaperone PCu(A)C [Radicibacter daui]|uniref:copper chaperone PCu(A)C n=1 Tax=Radicibacter daui TaxID=3064829 RepID=UPI004047022A
MTRRLSSARRLLAASALAVGLSAALPATRPAFADAVPAGTVVAGPLTVVGPWTRATAGAGRTSAVYFSIVNTGPADTLLSATGDDFAMGEVHEHVNDGGIMRMRPVEGGLPVPAGTTELKPGGYHLMLVGLKAALKPGETLPVILHFEKEGDVPVMVSITAMGATGAPMVTPTEGGKAN